MAVSSQERKNIRAVRIPCFDIEVRKYHSMPLHGHEGRLGGQSLWFRPFAWERAMWHLAECEKCRNENGLTFEEVAEELWRLERIKELFIRASDQ